jgi:glyoxylase I family protein
MNKKILNIAHRFLNFRNKICSSFNKYRRDGAGQNTKNFMPGFLDFHHVTICARNVDKTLAFYRDLLDFTFLGHLSYNDKKGSTADFLNIGNNGILKIVGFKNISVKPSEFIYDDLQMGMRHIGFIVKNVDMTAAWLKKAGVKFVMKPTDAVGGARIAFFKDPDGVVIQIQEGRDKYHVQGQKPLPAPLPVKDVTGNYNMYFDHLALTVADLKKSLAFYQEILGFPVLGQLFFNDERGYVFTCLQFGNSFLELFSFEKAKVIPYTWNRDETVLGLKNIGMLIENVRDITKSLTQKGVNIISHPKRSKEGVNTCLIADPDGNIFQLTDEKQKYDK